MGNKKPAILLIFFLIITVLLIPLSIEFGDIKIPFLKALDGLIHPNGSVESVIIWEYRLPRTLVGVFVGMNLAIAGTLLQAVTQNPLAAPNIIGITAGASFVTVLSMFFIPFLPISYLPIAAFAGSALAGILVYFVAWKNGISKERFALAGIAIDALFQAATTGMIVFASKKIEASIVWLAGSFWGRGWEHVLMILPWSVIGIILTLILSSRINAIQLGDDIATSLGVSVQRSRIFLLIITVVLAGSAVAVSGPIGFIGLVIPHLSRLLVGNDHKWVLPISALLGAMLAVISDLIGRTLLAPIEIPVGVITALLGAPYFLYLLKKSRL
ncbi:iron ABC transporter permease [Bacillus sp. EAC]|uniref:FecCD family ABC transporter permease n=1 Tax=Bacillus sp. EAC TaxID=1978338 RepID=UPI000B454579|nr:iron ABC transporter permease [Bacillus sp. EAC]